MVGLCESVSAAPDSGKGSPVPPLPKSPPCLSLRRLLACQRPGVSPCRSLPEEGAGRDAWVASVPALMDGRRCLRGGDSSGHRAHRAPIAPTAPGLPGVSGLGPWSRLESSATVFPASPAGCGRCLSHRVGPRVLPPRRPGAAPAPPPSPPARGPPRAGPTAAGHGRATGGGGRLSAAEGPRGGLLSLRVPLLAARSSQPRTSWLATGTRPGGGSGVVLSRCPVELVVLCPRAMR